MLGACVTKLVTNKLIIKQIREIKMQEISYTSSKSMNFDFCLLLTKVPNNLRCNSKSWMNGSKYTIMKHAEQLISVILYNSCQQYVNQHKNFAIGIACNLFQLCRSWEIGAIKLLYSIIKPKITSKNRKKSYKCPHFLHQNSKLFTVCSFT